MTVQPQAATGNVLGPGAAGTMSGKTPGLRENDPPQPGELPQTPWEIEGPYYRLGTPERSNLLEPGDKPAFTLTGRVLTPQGRPIPGAVISFWHASSIGEYDMVGYRYSGYVVTDQAGRYQLTTIIPGAYQPRQARHLHVKVQAVSRPVTTQLYIQGEAGNTDDDYYNPVLFVGCSVDADGVKHGTFDFVVAQFTENENVTPESLAARA